MESAKEKAKELVDKYLNADYTDINIHGAKQCALIAVEEVFSVIGDDYFTKYEFYLEVKNQLENYE